METTDSFDSQSLESETDTGSFVPGRCIEISGEVRRRVLMQIAEQKGLNNVDSSKDFGEFEHNMTAKIAALQNQEFRDIKGAPKHLEDLRGLVDDFNESHCGSAMPGEEKILLTQSEFKFEVVPHGVRFYAYFSPCTISLYQFSDSKRFKLEVRSINVEEN